jgi:hypothetical protein
MTDDRLVELLELTASRVPDSDPPLAALLREGRRGVRRRRLAGVAASGAILAIVVAFAGVTMAGHRGDVSVGPSWNTRMPTPPVGMKWSGIGHDVVAVPRGWSMWPGLYCGSLDGHDHVTIVEAGVTVGCIPILPHVPPWSIVSLSEQDGRLHAELEPGSPMTATMRRQSAELGQRIAQSRTTLPPGWLAVPAAQPSRRAGTPSVADEIRTLEAAGFHVVKVQEPSWGLGPDVRTEPEIGAPARVGSTVTVYQQLPAPASASLQGRLLWVGGAAPGGPVEHPGTVHIVGNGVDRYLSASRSRGFSFQGPAGTYTVTASSPGYLSKNGVPGSCRAVHPVTLKWITTAKVDVYCQLK